MGLQTKHIDISDLIELLNDIEIQRKKSQELSDSLAAIHYRLKVKLMSIHLEQQKDN